MKKILKYISVVAVMLFTLSCNDFLTYKNKDMVVPKELVHYDELIFGELIKKSASNSFFHLDIMSDDIADAVKVSTDSDNRTAYSGWYRWDKEPQIDVLGGELIDPTWEFLYHKILVCNIIEDEVNKYDESELRHRLIGEVKFIRAMSYFYLINMFGMPYKDESQATTALGVPINTEVSIRQNSLTRSTVAQVYDVIEKDLISAIDLLNNGDGKHSKFRPNVDVARLLLARTYLFTKKYDKAITTVNDLLFTTTHQLQSLADINANIKSTTVLYSSGNKGILFTWGMANASPWTSSNAYADIKYITAPELKDMYSSNDLRARYFFGWYNECIKSDGYTMNIYRRGFRLEEAYLIRAEAYAETNKLQPALDDVNEIRINRIEGGDVLRSSDDAATVLGYVRDERRMEMCFEELRWFDIRRWEIEIEHIYTDRTNPSAYERFVLKKGSPNYVMPIPFTESRQNAKIERLERVDCKVN